MKFLEEKEKGETHERRFEARLSRRTWIDPNI